MIPIGITHGFSPTWAERTCEWRILVKMLSWRGRGTGRGGEAMICSRWVNRCSATSIIDRTLVISGTWVTRVTGVTGEGGGIELHWHDGGDPRVVSCPRPYVGDGEAGTRVRSIIERIEVSRSYQELFVSRISFNGIKFWALTHF